LTANLRLSTCLRGAVLALAAIAAIPAAHAVRDRQKENPITNFPEEGPWRESKVVPPSYPTDRSLVEFKLTGQTVNRFFVDTSSLSVGEDEVVRFVLVIQTPEKAQNVSFAGLRCETQEWKDYAFANRDHTWRVEEAAQWRLIRERNVNNYQYTLFKDYFCYGGVMSGGPAGDAKVLVRNLKYPLVQDNRAPRRYNSTRSN
jgi:hypothetical protein